MKQVILIMALVFGMSLSAKEQKPIVDSLNNSSVTVVSDTTATDSAEYKDTSLDNNESSNDFDMSFPFAGLDGSSKALAAGGIFLAMFVLLLIFGFPILLIGIILLIIFRSRNKEKRMRYEMAQEYLKKGKEIPQELLEKPKTEAQNLREKGIKNIFLGAGLTIFFYFFFDSMAFASIGMLIMCLGLGQMVIAKDRKDTVFFDKGPSFNNKEEKNYTENNEPTESVKEENTAEKAE